MTTQGGELRGQVAIVTGAASGIGRAIAEAFARLGARVAVSDLNEAAAGRAAASIRQAGGDALGLRADVSDAQEVRATVERVRAELGGVDILVNNAGLQHVAPIVDLSEDKWSLVIGVHLTGTFLCTKAVLEKVVLKDVPQKRLLEPEEVAGMAC